MHCPLVAVASGDWRADLLRETVAVASILSASQFRKSVKAWAEVRLPPGSGWAHAKGINRTIRICCGIIEAMTPAERDDPSLVIDPSRAARIALGAGTDVATVEECVDVWLNHDGYTPWRMPAGWRSLLDYSQANQSLTELCEATHASLLVGTCPWCELAVIPQSTDDTILRYAGDTSSTD